MTAPVVAVDIGGTHIRAAVVDRGDITSTHSQPTPAAEGRTAVAAAVIESITTVRAGHDVAGIAISTAGTVDPETGTITSATDLISDWAGTPLGHDVAHATGVPVRVVNDVQAHTWGELRYGAGRGVASMLLVAAGTGLGGGFALDGHVVSGAHHVAGHLGHIPSPRAHELMCSCGVPGHLEAVASGWGLAQRYRQRGTELTAAQVSAAAEQGDRWAQDCLVEAATALGEAVGGLMNTLDPDAVVVTGGLSTAGQLWWTALREAAASQALPPVQATRIVAAEHPDTAALLGAASLIVSDRTP